MGPSVRLSPCRGRPVLYRWRKSAAGCSVVRSTPIVGIPDERTGDHLPADTFADGIFGALADETELDARWHGLMTAAGIATPVHDTAETPILV